MSKYQFFFVFVGKNELNQFCKIACANGKDVCFIDLCYDTSKKMTMKLFLLRQLQII
jgi:hypothetical protein